MPLPSALAGFNVRTPGELPEGSTLQEIAVQSGPAMKFDIQMAMVRMLSESSTMSMVLGMDFLIYPH
jgi:hypothetical protein